MPTPPPREPFVLVVKRTFALEARREVCCRFTAAGFLPFFGIEFDEIKKRHFFFFFPSKRFIGGGGVALEQILFVLPIVRSKLELLLMRPLQAKFGKMDQKDQRRRRVWVGQADFSKIAQRKQKFIKRVRCVFI